MLTCFFAKLGLAIDPLNFPLLEELSIAGFYTSFKQEGFNACDQLTLTNGPQRSQAHNNNFLI